MILLRVSIRLKIPIEVPFNVRGDDGGLDRNVEFHRGRIRRFVVMTLIVFRSFRNMNINSANIMNE